MPEPDTLKVTFLGTGCPIPEPGRTGPCQIVWARGEPLLFDCGWAALYQIVKAGIDPRAVTRLFVTHMHNDHVSGYANFAIESWAMGRKSLNVYGPKGIARATELLFGEILKGDIDYRLSLGRPPTGMTDIQVTEISGEGIVCQGEGWTVTAARVDHSHNIDCFGFRVDADGKSVVLSGDTAYCTEMVQLAQGADLLVMDCNNIFQLPGSEAQVIPEYVKQALLKEHPTPQEAARMAQEAGAKKLLLTHFMRGAVAERILDACRDHFDGETIVAEDLLEVSVG